MFSIHYHPEVVARDIPALNRDIGKRIRKAIENRLANEPELYGKPLRGELKSYWSLRVGDHRVIYQIEGASVIIIRIATRRDAYEAGFLEARKLRLF